MCVDILYLGRGKHAGRNGQVEIEKRVCGARRVAVFV